jgi:hypothetical protein
MSPGWEGARLKLVMVRRVASLMAVVLLALSLLGAASARDSVPGDLLYPVKRGAEAARAAFTPPSAQTALHTNLAANRIAELWEVFGRGAASPEIIDALTFDMLSETEIALQHVSDAPPDQQSQLLQRLMDRIELQQTLLIALMRSATEIEQAGLERALDALNVHRTLAQALLGVAMAGTADAPPKAGPSRTPMPSATQPDTASVTPGQGEPALAATTPATTVARAVATQRRSPPRTSTAAPATPVLVLPSATPTPTEPPAPVAAATLTETPVSFNPPAQPPSATATPPPASATLPSAADTATTTPAPIIIPTKAPPTNTPLPTQPPPTATVPPTATAPPTKTASPQPSATPNESPTATPCPTNPGGQPKCDRED